MTNTLDYYAVVLFVVIKSLKYNQCCINFSSSQTGLKNKLQCSFTIKLFILVMLASKASGLYYKHVTIVIYNHNDSGLY